MISRYAALDACNRGMVPATIYAGDVASWVDPGVPNDATAVAVWFRTNTAGAGVEATGVLADGKWTVTIDGLVSAGMAPGVWAYQAIAATPSGPITYSTGRVQVLASLSYTGTPAAVDLRSQAEQDLEAVEQAIRTLQSGAQSYTIGTGSGGRTFTRVQLGALIAWRDRLIAQIAAEQQATGSGRRDRRILVRFD